MSETSAREARQAFIACRAFGHKWSDIPLTERKVRWLSGFTQVVRCDNCTTHRTQILNWEGKPQNTKYEYPEAFSDIKGMSRADAKVEMYRLSGGRVRKGTPSAVAS